MTGRGRLALAASFVVAAAGAGGWVWFVSRHTPADSSTWATVLAVFFGLLAIPAVVIAWLTLKATRSDGQQPENKSPTVTFTHNVIAGNPEIKIWQNSTDNSNASGDGT
jgi:hypothetical protein